MPRKGYINDVEMCKKIIEYWNKGLSYSQIAKACDISRSVIGTVVRELRHAGFIDGRKVKNEPRVLVPGTVNCTPIVSRKCIYGIGWKQSSYSGTCNYILCEGHSRGCSAKACTKYQEYRYNREHDSISQRNIEILKGLIEKNGGKGKCK